MSREMSETNIEELLEGRTVKDVRLDGDDVTLHLEEGTKVELSLVSDCCSESYFADLRVFEELRGCKILKVEDREGQSPSAEGWSEEDTISLKYHFLVFTTDKGHVTVDWRNDSNGYYDGWLVAREVRL